MKLSLIKFITVFSLVLSFSVLAESKHNIDSGKKVKGGRGEGFSGADFTSYHIPVEFKRKIEVKTLDDSYKLCMMEQLENSMTSFFLKDIYNDEEVNCRFYNIYSELDSTSFKTISRQTLKCVVSRTSFLKLTLSTVTEQFGSLEEISSNLYLLIKEKSKSALSVESDELLLKMPVWSYEEDAHVTKKDLLRGIVLESEPFVKEVILNNIPDTSEDVKIAFYHDNYIPLEEYGSNKLIRLKTPMEFNMSEYTTCLIEKVYEGVPEESDVVE